MRRVPWLISLVIVATCSFTVPADAALKLDSGTSGATLIVDAQGRAQISWTRGGVRRSAVVTGSAVRYGGGVTNSAKAVKVAPTVPFALAQVQLPNGEQFALQQVNRLGQYGKLGPAELYIARWTGDPTSLTMTTSGDRICGTATYHGKAFYGFAHTSAGNPLDSLGRNVYLDTLRPSGWYRMLGVLARPLGYALVIRDEWVGSRYRGLIVGPNVSGDLAPVAEAETDAGAGGACPFPPGTYRNA